MPDTTFTFTWNVPIKDGYAQLGNGDIMEVEAFKKAMQEAGWEVGEDTHIRLVHKMDLSQS